jgi:hypothetical protein
MSVMNKDWTLLQGVPQLQTTSGDAETFDFNKHAARSNVVVKTLL